MCKEVKTLIIPDLHNKYTEAEIIIKKEKPGKIIFLGDYFDDYNDSPEIVGRVARWLKKSMKDPKRVHLIGNHDLSYTTHKPQYHCPGWDGSKHFVIDKVGIDWKKLKHFAWHQGWLFTHAGLTKKFFEKFSNSGELPREFMARFSIDDDLRENLYSVGPLRGGDQDELGGPLWCELEEFENIKYTKQMFGHSARSYPTFEKKSENNQFYCIDTHLLHYAVHENGKMYIAENTNCRFNSLKS